MYPQRSVTVHCLPAARQHSLQQLWAISFLLIAAVLLSVYSHPVHAEQNTPALVTPEATASPFYQQLQVSTKRDPVDNNSLLQQVTASNMMFDATPIDRQQDDDLAFNYLWMQQYQHGYQQKEGGAAMGKILRMGVKSLYNAYTGNASNLSNTQDFNHSYSNLDYRLRLSGDKVKLGIKYEF